MTLLLQYYITLFNNYLHAARNELVIIGELRRDTEESHVDHTHEIEERTEVLHYDLQIASIDLFDAMII